jgi:hypothetical protein
VDVVGGAAEVGIYVLVALAVVVLLIAFGLVVWVPLVRACSAIRDAWGRRRLRATRDPQ